VLSVLLTAKNTLSTRLFSVKSRIDTHLGTNNAGFAAMTRTMRGLSNAEDLPVFEFDGITVRQRPQRAIYYIIQSVRPSASFPPVCID